MRRLNTVHVDAEMAWGGGQEQVAGLCSYLAGRGHGVRVVCQPGSKLESWAATRGLDVTAVRMRAMLDLLAIGAIGRLLGDARPDVVHLHSSKAHVLGSAAARLARYRVVVATRRVAFPIRMAWPNTSAYGRWTTALVAISAAVRDAMVDSGVDPAKIRVIESGADVARFEQAVPDPGLRKSLGIDAETPIVCAAASLTACKGIEHLVEAMAILAGSGLRAHLVVAGDGELRPRLATLAARLGAAASFIGFRTDLPGLLADADAFAMPSLSEGLGIAALEAMAAGKPVVASAVGGLTESVVDGVTGFLVPPGDAAAMAEALRKLLVDRPLAVALGVAGRARVRESFSLDNMARRNEKLYFELLGG